MKSHSLAAVSLLCAGMFCSASSVAQSDGSARDLAQQSSKASATSNVPQRAGEASTMTDGVPNLMTSNLQPGELGIQTRLTVRQAPGQAVSEPDLKLMGAAPWVSGLAHRPSSQLQSPGGTPD